MIVAGRFGANLNCAEGAILRGVCRSVSDGVLIANVASDLRAERNNFANRFRLKKFAASRVGDLLPERPDSYRGRSLVKQADGVDDSVGIRRASVKICFRFARELALSPPSLITMRTFLSRVPRFSWLSEADIAS